MTEIISFGADRAFYFPSANGINQILCREWLPIGEVKAVLQISHGVSEHSGRYDRFARFLTAHGFAVVANDHLGHGGSVAEGGTAMYFAEENGWNSVVDDMYTLYEISRLAHPNVPYFIFGQNLGSLVLRTFLIDHPELLLCGAILCGTGSMPAYALEGGIRLCKSAIKKNGGDRSYSPLLKDLVFDGNNEKIERVRTEVDWLSRDDAEVDKYIKDPMCGADATLGLIRDMLGGYLYVERMVNVWKMRKDIPILIISGTDDPAGNYSKGVKRVKRTFDKVGMEDVTLKLYPGARHELLNETNRAEVIGDILAWLKIQLTNNK